MMATTMNDSDETPSVTRGSEEWREQLRAEYQSQQRSPAWQAVHGLARALTELPPLFAVLWLGSEVLLVSLVHPRDLAITAAIADVLLFLGILWLGNVE